MFLSRGTFPKPKQLNNNKKIIKRPLILSPSSHPFFLAFLPIIYPPTNKDAIGMIILRIVRNLPLIKPI